MDAKELKANIKELQKQMKNKNIQINVLYEVLEGLEEDYSALSIEIFNKKAELKFKQKESGV